MVGLPPRVAREGISRTFEGAQEARGKAWESFGGTADRVMRLSGAAREGAISGRNASLGRAERVARREGATQTAGTLHEARRGLGTLDESELPIPDYAELNQRDAVRRHQGSARQRRRAHHRGLRASAPEPVGCPRGGACPNHRDRRTDTQLSRDVCCSRMRRLGRRDRSAAGGRGRPETGRVGSNRGGYPAR